MGYSVVSLYITEPGIEVFPCFVSYFLAALGSFLCGCLIVSIVCEWRSTFLPIRDISNQPSIKQTSFLLIKDWLV